MDPDPNCSKYQRQERGTSETNMKDYAGKENVTISIQVPEMGTPADLET